MLPRFHLAFPVNDLESTRSFYVDTLGCKVGRSADSWIDFDFYGHQISAHKLPGQRPSAPNAVDGDAVPIPHFGVIVTFDLFDMIAERIKRADHPFLIAPKTRFCDQPGEQRTMFFADPSGNAIEIKAFADDQSVFWR